MNENRYDEGDHGAGWLLFAGIMLLLVGILNTVGGIAAIDSANFYTANAHYQFGDLSMWGWILLIIGIAQLISAWSIWSGGAFGRWVGVLTATLNAGAQLFFLPSYPFWSLAIFAIDILIIYGLVVYGGVRAPARP